VLSTCEGLEPHEEHVLWECPINGASRSNHPTSDKGHSEAPRDINVYDCPWEFVQSARGVEDSVAARPYLRPKVAKHHNRDVNSWTTDKESRML
jgi:hypothetical protein